MAQKNKVKELVGRGLNSYHTKALQQMDRIEKKNKEQNHKISILSNELDNDYLTKTEEGSVVSLEHSKEGMVYLDELQGNTLVNYCTDGSNEMTLNGDIDVEGIFVTTTEGVDNGKIDVLCEGSTLVNLVKKSVPSWCHADNDNGNTYEVVRRDSYIKITGNNLEDSVYRYVNAGKPIMTMLKPSTEYTICFKTLKLPQKSSIKIVNGNATNYATNNVEYVDGVTKYKLVTDSSFVVSNQVIYIWINSTLTNLNIEIENPILLEGDWTNKEVPTEFFEGMKSVGQDDENGHKIEILSNKSINILEDTAIGSDERDIIYWKNGLTTDYIPCKPNKKYSIGNLPQYKNRNRWLCFDENKNAISESYRESVDEYTTVSNAKYFVHYFYTDPSIRKDANINLIINDADFSNKKEISLNEPLRSLPNGVKDKIIKIGGKYYVERNCGEIDLSTINEWNSWGDKGTEYYGFYQYVSGLSRVVNESEVNVCCPTRPCIRDIEDIRSALSAGVHAGMGEPFGYIAIGFKRSELTELTSNGVKEWLSKNPTKVVAQLETPIYEELPIDPTINTYIDITHISNNSTVPCNMVVKNSGYNAIIKPSTLYTVALDTNKSGTIGLNLGGAKVTTTNNVATITTPATLADDSLRLYGKGIKASKVRLLEGDKTNWIPSHFEGMKSSFEDKLQEDGLYKMEILSYNGVAKKTDLELGNIYGSNGNPYNSTNTVRTIDFIDVLPNTCYELTSPAGVIRFYNREGGYIYNPITISSEFITPHNCYKLKLVFNTNDINTDYSLKVKNTIGDMEKYNKIQFSSIEPLRGVGNVRDRFVFKDNKLMIERNCKKLRLTTENLKLQGRHGANTRFYYDVRLLGFDMGQKPLCVENLKQVDFYDKSYTSKSSCLPCYGYDIDWGGWQVGIYMPNNEIKTLEDANVWLNENVINSTWKLSEPTYEEIPFELQKIILEGYENGTLFFDTNIPPTSTVTYAGETPIVKATKLNKTEVLSNTEDINDNIIPYLMDMDYRVVMLQLATEELEGGVSMARLFGGTYEMIKRDILSKRLTREEYGYRLADYYNAGKLTEEQVRELEDLR